MIPDYPQRVQEAHNKLAHQAENTRTGWQDTVSQRFFNDYVTRFHDDTKQYVQELNSTLTTIEKCKNEMDALM